MTMLCGPLLICWFCRGRAHPSLGMQGRGDETKAVGVAPAVSGDVGVSRSPGDKEQVGDGSLPARPGASSIRVGLVALQPCAGCCIELAA